MTNMRRPPRLVPELTAEEEAYLSWISDSKRFTIEAALARHAGAVWLRPLTDVADAIISNVQNLHIASEGAAMPSNLEPRNARQT